MSGMWIRGKTLWREDYIWAYYLGVGVLFLGRFVFSLNDLLNLIPLYGLFITNLVLMIVHQHRRHGMEKIIHLTEWRPLRRAAQELFFASICSLPAGLLLFALLRDTFPGTPRFLLAFLVLNLLVFAVGLGFALSVLPFKYATLLSLLLYFLLVAFNGYRLESIPYLAPTLNFMYPDYPNYANVGAVYGLSALLFVFYLMQKVNESRSHRRWVRWSLMAIFVCYALIPAADKLLEQRAEQAGYQRTNVEGIQVNYRGVPERQAKRYAQVVADVLAAARREADPQEYEQQKNVEQIEQVTVTWQSDIPQGEGIEHILKLDGRTLHIQPYSHKFYEFNYGYNILRDLTQLLIRDPGVRQQVAAQILREDSHGWFRATRLRAEE
ncbi:hypothetical protein B9G55_12795 [Saccharibacillus sp. O16]|nr:hypothetical protein B9G55_12795 [Saccharibacillus sp. O16]